MYHRSETKLLFAFPNNNALSFLVQRNIILFSGLNLYIRPSVKTGGLSQDKSDLYWVLYNNRKRISCCSKGSLTQKRKDNSWKANRERGLAQVPGARHLFCSCRLLPESRMGLTPDKPWDSHGRGATKIQSSLWQVAEGPKPSQEDVLSLPLAGVPLKGTCSKAGTCLPVCI